VLSEALKNRTDNHDEGTGHDGPPTTVALCKPRSDGHRENGAELVARVDEAQQTRFDSRLVVVVNTSVSEI